ncbi:PAS domain-containing protein [Belliella kenyensis]|uniref:histidine kinase n=1 Tax=Belliella kenyensis TaxID=1472724 RepID=A0ABV8EGM6_9BACT|nr:PAS domain-containing protein [Belliella kenyensis]MCH7400974.1 PAS domain-containing protein [Belliella kenyensis]MDN3603972.1 PAS domain-containing protein [Belliella kenyensis]
MSPQEKQPHNEYGYHLPDWIYKSGLFYVLIVDMEGKVLYINDYFSKKFFNIKANFERKSFFEYIVSEDLDLAIHTASLCTKNPEQSFQVDLRNHLIVSGQKVSTRWAFTSILGAQNLPLGILMVGFDVSIREKDLPRPAIKKFQFDKVFNFLSDCIICLNDHLDTIHSNKAAEKLFNLESDDEKNSTFKFSKSQNQASPLWNAIKESKSNNKIIDFQEYHEELDLYFYGIVIPSESNVMIIVRDNTREIQAKFLLLESENKLKAILNSTTDCIILINQEFKVMAFNKVAIKHCQTTSNKRISIGVDYRDFILKEIEQEFYPNFIAALHGEIKVFEKELLRNDNKLQWVEFMFYPVYDSNEQMIGVTQLIKDITKSKEQIAKIRAQYEKFKEIAWIQSHEVRSPLANIMGLVEMLKTDRDSMDESEIQSFFNNILSEAEKLDQKIRKITKATEEQLGLQSTDEFKKQV